MSPPISLVDPRSLVRDARFGALGIPRGWFVVGFSDEIPAERVVTLRYFGLELVAFRGPSGAVTVADAYCPHLGAHLGCGGVVEDGALRCPFHRWRFEADGHCAEIPYSDVVPREARLKTFPVREQNGTVHVFFDPSGTVEPWELPVLDEEGWTPPRTVHWRALTTHPQEVFENTVDTAHIGPIHAGRRAHLVGKPAMNGERLDVEIEFDAPGDVVGMPDQINDVQLRVALRGLGWVVVQTHVRNVDVRARQRIFVTPIDAERVDIRAMVQVRETSDPAFTEELAVLFHRAYVEDFAKDFPIWENKRYLARPRLAKGDGPIGGYRRWCTQFYDVRAEAAPAAVAASETGWTRLRDRAKEIASRLGAFVPGAIGTASARPASMQTAPKTPVEDRAPAPASDEHPRVAPAASPARKVASADEYYDTLVDRFVPAAARGLDAVFQWELGGEGGSVFHAHVHDGAIEVATGPHSQPSVALVMDATDYVKVVNGELDGMRAFTTGRGKVRGSLPLAMKMRALFPAP